MAAAFFLLIAASVYADEDEDEYHYGHRSGGKGYFAIGWSSLDLGPLNDALTTGYQHFSEDFLSLGGGGYGIIGRFVIGGQGHGYLGESRDVRLGTSNFRSDLSAGMGFVDLGWVLWTSSGWSLTPLVGLGGGGLSMQIDALSSPTFGEVLAQPGHRSTLSTGGFLVDLGASFDHVLSQPDRGDHGGLLFGIRAGWILAPFHGDWQLEGRDISGGPDLGITGPYVRFMFGGGSQPD